MSAQFKYAFTNPTTVETTLSVTMTVAEWVRLSEQLESAAGKSPAWEFRREISQLVEKAHKNFFSMTSGELIGKPSEGSAP